VRRQQAHRRHRAHTNMPPHATLASEATTFRTLWPAGRSGIGLVDPIAMAVPSFLGGWTDCLPLLMTSPTLRPLLADTGRGSRAENVRFFIRGLF
jgi:hypothetical protein